MISFKVRIFRLGSLPLLLGGLLGCNSLIDYGIAVPEESNVPLTQVSELEQQQNNGSTIYLKGKVGSQAPFLGSGAYQLQDSTGSVWVLADENLPDRGDEVVIKVQVEYQSIPIGEQDLGQLYVVELEQLERQTNLPPKQ